MSTELAFMLGVLWGMALPLAVRSLNTLLNIRRSRRTTAFNAAVDAEITRRELEQWGIVRSPHTTSVDLTNGEHR